MGIYIEDWAPAYGGPNLIDPANSGDANAALVEDGVLLVAHGPFATIEARLAFVDGVRRVEASLWQEDNGTSARGIAGGYAVGSVLAEPGLSPAFGEHVLGRVVVWGSGMTGQLPDVAGGFSWAPTSISSPDPDAPLRELQDRMRREEGALADRLCGDGWIVVTDGPLSYALTRDLPVVGYVKTHYRQWLTPDLHRLVPRLQRGERTSLFALGDDRYSTYLRLAESSPLAGPWAGIVRLEVPQQSGLVEAVRLADLAAAVLPRFAGVAHRDPRAPQNLQPVGALEQRLRHLLGDERLAVRAVRDAVDILARTSAAPAGAGAAPMTPYLEELS